ncbi:hypothetical protein Tco_0366300 [Tanacetum coccineum]
MSETEPIPSHRVRYCHSVSLYPRKMQDLYGKAIKARFRGNEASKEDCKRLFCGFVQNWLPTGFYSDEFICSLLCSTSIYAHKLNDDEELLKIDEDAMERNDIRWQVAMNNSKEDKEGRLLNTRKAEQWCNEKRIVAWLLKIKSKAWVLGNRRINDDIDWTTMEFDCMNQCDLDDFDWSNKAEMHQYLLALRLQTQMVPYCSKCNLDTTSAVLSRSTDGSYYPRMDNRRPRISSYSPSSRSSTTRTPHRPQRPKKIVKSIWVKKGSTVGSKQGNGSYTLKQFEAIRRRSSRDYHNVLFIDKECLILSPKFKFVDEDLVILRAPRKNDVYSLDLKNIIPSGGITCLGILQEDLRDRTVREPLELLHHGLIWTVSVESINKEKSTAWLRHKCEDHRCVHGTEFKNQLMNEFWCMKGINRGNIALPQESSHSKIGVAERKNRLSLKLLERIVAAPFYPIQILGFLKQSILLVILFTLAFGMFDGKSEEGYLLGYSTNSKGFRVYNSTWQYTTDSDVDTPKVGIFSTNSFIWMLRKAELHEVWVLCDLPEGKKRVIGKLKWVLEKESMNGVLLSKQSTPSGHKGTTRKKVWIMMKYLHQVARIEATDSFWHLHLSWALCLSDGCQKSFLYGNITKRGYLSKGLQVLKILLIQKGYRVVKGTLWPAASCPTEHGFKSLQRFLIYMLSKGSLASTVLTGLLHINYSLLVDLIFIGPCFNNFGPTLTLKVINDIPHIRAKQVIWDVLRDIGYEGNLAQLTFSKPLFSPQWKYLVHVLLHCLSPKSTSWEQFGTNIASALVEVVNSIGSGGRTIVLVPLLGCCLPFCKGKLKALPLQSAAPSNVLPQYKSIQNLKKQKSDEDEERSIEESVFSQLGGIRKSDETEKVNIEEKEASNVRSGDTEELDLETTQSTARQSTITPRTLNFEEEAGPSSPLRPIQVMDSEEQRNAAEVLVSISRPRGLSIPGPIQTQPQQPTQGTDPKDKGKGILVEEPKKKKLTLQQKSELGTLQYFEKNAQDKESLEGISMITELQVIDSPDGEYLIIHRANNHFRAFDTLWEILHVLDRQDLYHLYRVVDDYYEHIPPTGLGLSLLGDLNIIWETAESSDDDFWKDQEEWEIIRWRFHESSGVHTLEIEDGTMIHMLAERRYPLSRELMIRMLEHGMEVEDESETAITLIHLFILWTTENGDNS